jgi:hypothetical protein
MYESALVSIVGEEIVLEEERKTGRRISKWSTFVDGKDGFLYGIPWEARRVAKFNPVDKSMEMIGPDLGDNTLWACGVLAKNGCIYCPPSDYGDDNSFKMLKIYTNDGTVVSFGINEGEWMSGALGADDCIYFCPFYKIDRDTIHILRVDPDTDTLSNIELPDCSYLSFVGTVLGKDNCIYGLLQNNYTEKCVLRFDPMNPQDISFFGNAGQEYHEDEFDEEEDKSFDFNTDGVLGNDGHIYALNYYGQVLKVDTSKRIVSTMQKKLKSGYITRPIIGLDQCIYWPSRDAKDRVLKFDPTTQSTRKYDSIGLDVVYLEGDECNWFGGALASDGVIYCAPLDANRVFAIDPLRELSINMKQRMIFYPDELGRLFLQNNESYSESLFESAVRKFGLARALRLLDECLPSDDEWAERHRSVDSVSLDKSEASGGRKRKRSYKSVPLFVLAASGCWNVGDVPLGVIYHLMRRNVSGLMVS